MLVIVGVLSAMVIPRFARSIEIHRANAAAERVKRDLGLARESAIVTSQNVTMTFNVVSDEYIIEGLTHLDDPNAKYKVTLSESPFRADLSQADFGGSTQVIFDGYGLADNDGKILIEAGRQQTAVKFDAETGNTAVSSQGK